MIAAIKYKCSRIYGETKPSNVLTNQSGWSTLYLHIFISLLMIPRKRRVSRVIHVIRRHNDYINVKTYRLRDSYFFLTLDISIIAMMVQRWRKLEISLYFSSHTKQCAQSLLWMLFMPCIFLLLFTISTISSRDSVISKLSLDFDYSFSLLHLIILIIHSVHIYLHSFYICLIKFYWQKKMNSTIHVIVIRLKECNFTQIYERLR